eukprot:5573337-Prymnesium_polylepis.1
MGSRGASLAFCCRTASRYAACASCFRFNSSPWAVTNSVIFSRSCRSFSSCGGGWSAGPG